MKIVVSDEAALHAQRAYDGKAGYSRLERLRAALEAAAPYLEPAGFDGHKPDECRWPDTLGRCTHAAERRAASAGDGGLREALEKIKAELEERSNDGEAHLFLNIPYWQLEELLAAHPAAPAVPQPATLPTCVNCESETFECSACGSLVEPWGSAVPQPVDREAVVRAIVKAAKQHVVENPDAVWVDGWAGDFADAVLAVLAGEQEQVEP